MPPKILIVEDNELTMKLVADLLQVHGYSTLQSFDGTDVDILATGNKPDLILMDIKLKNLSGFEVLKTLKANYNLKHIPVIAMTALAMSGDKERILDSGFDSYIAKPMSTKTLLKAICAHIG